MMRGFRPRRLEGYSKGKGKKSLLEGDQFFSDEDEFDDVFYSEREKDYVKKSNKTWKSSTKTTIPPKKLPIPRPHPPCRQESVELTQSEAARNPKEEFAPSLSSELIEKGSILTKELTQSGISNVFKGSIARNVNNKEGVDAEHLKNVVSLHLQKKGINQIMSDAFQSFGSLAHLYLYDNKIMEMAGFSQLPQLESLHLSGNRIRRIADLKNSFNLRQLYLGQNEIEVIEGLENLSMLVELHIEHQRLPSEQSIIFSPNSLDTISRKLKVLNTSGNQLESIEDLLCMDVLDTLNLSRNRLTNLEHTSQVLRTLGQLRILDLRENRILKNPKYKEQIVGFCSGIEVLDEKDVNDTQRKTLQRMCAIKALRNQKQFQSTKTNPVHPVSSFPGAFRSVHRDQNVMQSRSVPVVMPLSAAKIYDEPFVFSTPISMSPTPDQFARMVTLPYDPASEGDVNTSEAEDLYAATRSSIQPAEEIESDSMSEMAKIIFRLSNLSPSNDNIGRARRSNHSSSHYWNVNRGFGDRFSTLKESRPLSPLEVEVPQSAMSKTQQNLGSVGRRPARRPMTRKLPPRKSMGAGRTLSPLEELPTPDSTVRDQLEGRSDWTSLQPWTTSLPQLLPRNKRVVGFAASDSKLMK